MYRRVLVLRFPPEVTDKPIICSLSHEFNLCFNIVKAEILPGKEGLMVLELYGAKKDLLDGLKYLRAQGVGIKSLTQEIRRNEDVCIQCGACAGICPSKALSVDPQTHEVVFDPAKCTACEFCVSVCPVRAMEINFSREKAAL